MLRTSGNVMVCDVELPDTLNARGLIPDWPSMLMVGERADPPAPYTLHRLGKTCWIISANEVEIDERECQGRTGQRQRSNGRESKIHGQAVVVVERCRIGIRER